MEREPSEDDMESNVNLQPKCTHGMEHVDMYCGICGHTLKEAYGEMRAFLKEIAEGEWLPQTSCEYAEDGRYAYPKREQNIRQRVKVFLDGKDGF